MSSDNFLQIFDVYTATGAHDNGDEKEEQTATQYCRRKVREAAKIKLFSVTRPLKRGGG